MRPVRRALSTAPLAVEILDPRQHLSTTATPLTDVADINFDGRADRIAVEPISGSTTQSRVTMSMGDGRGGFTPRQTSIANVGLPVAAFVAQMNGEGAPDQLIVARTGPNAADPLMVAIGITVGTETLYWYAQLSDSENLGPANGSWAWGDVNGDGFGDLTRLDPNGMVTTFRGGAWFGFSDVTHTFTFWGGNARQLALGDFDHDGRKDMAAITEAGVQVANVAAGGICSPPVMLNLGVRNKPELLAGGDANIDGRDDLVVGLARGGVLTYLQTAIGTFGQPVGSGAQLASTGTTRMYLRDIDGDTDGDLLAFGGGAATSQPVLARGNGAGVFSTQTITKLRDLPVFENTVVGEGTVA